MSEPTTIPSDVDREDRIVGPLTARQVAILAVTAVGLYAGWWASHALVPLGVYLVLTVPLGAVVFVAVTVQREGMSLDRLALAGLRHTLRPSRRVATNEPPVPAPAWMSLVASQTEQPATTRLDMPATDVDEAGVVDLGTDGLAVLAACSTVPFTLRTATEQQALLAAFGRYLHSLTAPVQILIRALPLDLSGQIQELQDTADSLPHPALREAALDHADHLASLNHNAQLLRRQVLLVAREPHPDTPSEAPIAGLRRLVGQWQPRSQPRESSAEGAMRSAAARLTRRIGEASDLLAPAGITLTPLAPRQARAVLAAATHPDSPMSPSPDLAGPDEIITTHSDGQEDH